MIRSVIGACGTEGERMRRLVLIAALVLAGCTPTVSNEVRSAGDCASWVTSARQEVADAEVSFEAGDFAQGMSQLQDADSDLGDAEDACEPPSEPLSVEDRTGPGSFPRRREDAEAQR
jgi:hypothetical protein